ncbi:uncharacterized protein PRCAT00004294001 [Priceomyces carsonii]|uniref:uncharacterized protein n=1 Tax=Priceomyces carsonii TaxID=28549 RepID=UPI002EDB435C|nr:unnamed protein product [Priceomyces carsonii]
MLANLKIGYFLNHNIERCKQKDAADSFIRIYSNENNKFFYDDNVQFTRWRRLVYNATLNCVCTILGVDTGRLELFGGNETIIRRAMREVLKVAESENIHIPEDVMEFMLRADDGVYYYSPFMLVDLRKGNYIELEVICGNVVRIAKHDDIKVPTLSLF